MPSKRIAILSRFRFLCVLFMCLFAISAWSGVLHARVIVKLGTIAPKGSIWYNTLKKMGEEWREVSEGEVVIKIYPGGVLGNEIDMVRKMRQGRLQAATITAIGIGQIDTAYLALQVPRMIQNTREVDACMEAILPIVSDRLEKEGFVIIQYGDTGWLRIFTATEVRTLEDMRKQKLFVAAADPKSKEAWNRAGFHTVSVNSTDILPSLQTGLIDGFGSTPLAALAMQWFGLAKHMIEFKWAPLIGGTIITKKTWDRIPPELRPKLKEIAIKYAKQNIIRARAMDNESIATMKKHGLKEIRLSPEEGKKVNQAIRKQWDYIRREIIPAEVFDLVRATVEKTRKSEADR